MSMLDRYRKAGGFVQLLNLLETSGKEKQEKFLALIRQEDASWAEALEGRILSMKKIMSWPTEALAEIVGVLQEMTLGVALHGMDDESRNKIYATMGHSQKRKVEQAFESQKPTPAEISTMYMKIITEVRKMITEGKLRMEKIDAHMVIDDEIEEKLRKGTLGSSNPGGEEIHLSGTEEIVTEAGTTLRFNLGPMTKEEPAETAAPTTAGEMQAMRKKLHLAQTENNSLKQEVSRLKLKLEQIRKLSA
jgi:hypothetical protein